ncbi:MAG TPA: hypothetical protein VMS17_29515 [Gemmataceae bacterium]|nr:hypothetical protein [Gemmataceae bacterium]
MIHLLLEIQLADDGFADAGEMDLCSQLVDAIESRGIGEVGGYGSGMGGMDISIIVADEQIGRRQIAAVLAEFAPKTAFSIRVLPPEDEA